jgi:type II secretory pathway pseudopilin PulG
MTAKHSRVRRVPGERSSEAGFTLVEALIAMVILMVGLAAVSNLMIVSATSNTAANLSTASTAAATSQMEVLKGQPFNTLTPGGNLASPVANYNATGGTPSVAGRGVGRVTVRWQIVQPPNPLTNVRFIQVRSQMLGRLGAGWSKADFTTFRACTDGTGCP